MKVENIKISDISKYERNARVHPEEQIRKIVDSIRDFGFNVPILVGPDKKIIAGHGRLEAAKRLKMKEVPCIVLDHLSDDDRRRYIAVDNLTHGMGSYDMETLKIEALAKTEKDLLAIHGVGDRLDTSGKKSKRTPFKVDINFEHDPRSASPVYIVPGPAIRWVQTDKRSMIKARKDAIPSDSFGGLGLNPYLWRF